MKADSWHPSTPLLLGLTTETGPQGASSTSRVLVPPTHPGTLYHSLSTGLSDRPGAHRAGTVPRSLLSPVLLLLPHPPSLPDPIPSLSSPGGRTCSGSPHSPGTPMSSVSTASHFLSVLSKCPVTCLPRAHGARVLLNAPHTCHWGGSMHPTVPALFTNFRMKHGGDNSCLAGCEAQVT